MSRRGWLVLVVGPSGAGKDSVIDGARRLLAGEARVRFARRCITRPADAGGEDHVALGADEFARRRAAGGFALSWHAHGLDYGLPAEILDWQAGGATVVANVSRSVLDEARRRHAPVRTVLITAAPEILAARLAARGREDAADIRARLSRKDFECGGDDVFVVDNDGPLQAAVSKFVELLPGASPERVQNWSSTKLADIRPLGGMS